MVKSLLGLTVVVGVLVGGFFLFNSYIYNEKQAEPEPIIVEDFEGESAYETECHDSERHFVITRGRANVGEDILVKPKAPGQTIRCHYVVAQGDVEFTGENPTYFLGIEGDFLVLDEGTAPPPRGLKIYDLVGKEFVYADTYNRPLEITGGSIVYWQALPTPANASNCPEYAQYTSQGLGAGLEREVVFAFSTLKASTTGKERCSARQ